MTRIVLAAGLALLLLAPPRAASAAEAAPTVPATGWTWPAEKLDIERAVATFPQEEQRRVRALLEVVDDDDTDSGRALAVRLDKKRVRERDCAFLFTPPVALPPGRYRATVRMKIAGMLNVLGTPIYLEAAGTNLAEVFRGYQFHAEDEYQEFTWDFDLSEPDAVTGRPPVYEPTSPFGGGPYLWKRLEPALQEMRRHRLGEFTPQEMQARARQAAAWKPHAVSLSMGFRQTRRTVKAGEDAPDSTLHSVTIDTLKLARLPEPAVRVREVAAAKRWLAPGDATSFSVWLSSRTGAEETVELALYLETGADRRERIASRAVRMPRDGYATEHFEYRTPADRTLWGCAVVAEASRDGRVLSSARDVFTVHPNNLAVKMMGQAGQPTYCNHVEVFGCTPGDCALVHLADPERPYRTGMSGYTTNNRSQKAAIAWNDEVGAATVMYLFPGYTQNWGADLYLRHPEWFVSRLNYTDEAYRLNLETAGKIAEAYAQGAAMPEEKDLKEFHLEGLLNCHDPALVDRITDGVIARMKELGYHGIRWDGGPLPVYELNALGERTAADRKDAMRRAAANFALMKRRVRDAGLKRFVNGFNGDSYGYSAIIHSLTAGQADPREFDQFAEMMKDGGMLMDESFAGAVGYRDPANVIRDYYRAHVQMRTACRKVGGHFEGFPPNWRGKGLLTTTDIYWHLLTVMAGAHMPAVYPPLPWCEDGLGHFITRYCEFLWDETLMPLPDADRRVRAATDRPLWVTDAAVCRPIPGGERWVIPIVNPPPGERFLQFRFGELPEPIRQPFDLVVQRPEALSGPVRAWMLTAEPRTASVPLKATVEGRKVTLSIPDLMLFRVVVLELSRPAGS